MPLPSTSSCHCRQRRRTINTTSIRVERRIRNTINYVCVCMYFLSIVLFPNIVLPSRDYLFLTIIRCVCLPKICDICFSSVILNFVAPMYIDTVGFPYPSYVLFRWFFTSFLLDFFIILNKMLGISRIFPSEANRGAFPILKKDVT